MGKAGEQRREGEQPVVPWEQLIDAGVGGDGGGKRGARYQGMLRRSSSTLPQDTTLGLAASTPPGNPVDPSHTDTQTNKQTDTAYIKFNAAGVVESPKRRHE